MFTIWEERFRMHFYVYPEKRVSRNECDLRQSWLDGKICCGVAPNDAHQTAYVYHFVVRRRVFAQPDQVSVFPPSA
jgi:hypothetical protein